MFELKAIKRLKAAKSLVVKSKENASIFCRILGLHFAYFRGPIRLFKAQK